MSTPRILHDYETIPNPTICRDVADESKPCPFGQHCNEARQRIQSGYRKVEGKWVRTSDVLWGRACWAFESFPARGVGSSNEPAPQRDREPGEEPF